MGIDPDADEDIAFTCGDFTCVDDWQINPPWSIAGGLAILNRLWPVEQSIRQTLPLLIVGNTYFLEFEIKNFSFVVPGTGIYCGLWWDQSPIFNTNGVKTVGLTYLGGTPEFYFSSDGFSVGDYAEIEYVTIRAEGDYVENVLGIEWPHPRKKEWWDLGGDEYMQIIASRNGKTNCLIKYSIA